MTGKRATTVCTLALPSSRLPIQLPFATSISPATAINKRRRHLVGAGRQYRDRAWEMGCHSSKSTQVADQSQKLGEQPEGEERNPEPHTEDVDRKDPSLKDGTLELRS
ncbi:hypothetical protein H920_00711 [Fukomys damarensis]|uniref:Uncharacterized protein n=1 Tax=Fukomys damarensis TaxID=885580 RepID=A0A091EQB8_FUKDA|nr:hypothetical protein H920_00711 [Fukomys damarensis]